MKVLKIIVVSFMMTGLLLSSGISTVEASGYLGEFCWHINNEDDGYDDIKLAVTDMGDAHFLLNGHTIDDEGIIQALHGNAEIVEDKIYITTTGSGINEYETWTYINSWILDMATLNGTIDGTTIYREKNDPNPEHIEVSYDGPRIITFVPCQ